MGEAKFGTPGSIEGDDSAFNREQIEEAVRRRIQGEKGVPNIVVSVPRYELAIDVILRLKKIGVEANITEGGLMLHLEKIEELAAAAKVLEEVQLRPQLGVTNFEAGRNAIRDINQENRRRGNAGAN